jgi:TolB-like protein
LLGGWSVWRSAATSITPISEKPSVAVLPFENIGGDPSWRRLADGLTQDITTDLSQSKDLLVIARNSTEIYRGKAADVRDVGRELGVGYVLQGSIQPRENRIRITSLLIDARSAETADEMKP